MFTRKQYMAKECTHQEYYAQFAPAAAVKDFVERNWTKEFIRICYAEDQHLNNLDGWKGTHKWMDRFDAFTRANSGYIASVNKKINGQSVYSLSDGTSAIKAYMKIYAGLV